ncbi:MAG: GNAT family N-acetyltransferase [Chloroflexi bacterium]|jgi:GNAT superfamily N-acetyltransferase|nr:GNAT family N-acetyltransferase [Chloroflexota bacterium]
MAEVTPTPITIRSLELSDSDRARELFVAGMNSQRPNLPNETAKGDLDGYLAHCLADDMANPYEHYVTSESKSGFWLAISGDEIVGTVAVAPSADRLDVAEVFRVSVDGRFRRQGIAGLLMDTAESWSIQNDYTGIMLQTTEYLAAAHRLYESRGYELRKRLQFGQIKGREYRKLLS